MSRRLEAAAFLALLALSGAAPAAMADDRYGVGRDATAGEIAGWDIDVRPDGQGLPAGRATAADGEELYEDRCASCHGEFGEAVGRYPALIGGADSLASDNPVKTVGSYWPYATTLWDYIYRAMPFDDAQSLTHDETYAITAYLLYLNDIIDEDFVVDRDSLARVEMPNRDGFVTSGSNPDTPSGEACMANCKEGVEIVSKATRLDVTPKAEAR